ncbi:hypothetical protein CDAR_442961 [Caerostris darwini]|uniref:Uncharacterized protein n=1 Tax=Caerostris darwini TaxID=1538125 RepID=A0AAV4VN20_9ARAC|nr:hypothetical protein CDAR_442961 [Caerostris darwini]
MEPLHHRLVDLSRLHISNAPKLRDRNAFHSRSRQTERQGCQERYLLSALSFDRQSRKTSKNSPGFSAFIKEAFVGAKKKSPKRIFPLFVINFLRDLRRNAFHSRSRQTERQGCQERYLLSALSFDRQSRKTSKNSPGFSAFIKEAFVGGKKNPRN